MGRVRNILFVMYDQLRFDYLSCAGHPHLATPNFDRLAAMGVRFANAYAQSPVCGASRMSAYTGRYVQSHGAAWNNYPLKVGEETLGDHLRRAGAECRLIGKTHMKADAEGMRRLGLTPDSVIGARVAEAGFDLHVREDGLYGDGPRPGYDPARSPYNDFLRARGYGGRNPWHDHANSGTDAAGRIASGWYLLENRLPANIREEDSETPWLTDRALEFLGERRGGRWLCHLSYIKPHWPYVVPAPYHAMFGPEHVLPARRSELERRGPHPVYAAFMDARVSRNFSRDEVRAAVIPAYMGLIRQADDQFGRLLDRLVETGALEETMIVVTSDHGDYLGDHWLGEKDLFHEPSVKVPLIVFDPAPEADAARGTVSDALVEQIDLAPTFLEALGAPWPDHVLEGRSLLPLLRGEAPGRWREFVVSEYDYGQSPMAGALGLAPRDARLFMLYDGRFKFVHAEGGFRPMLFDLAEDPDEFRDLGADPERAAILALMRERLAAWARRPSQRTTISEADILARRGRTDESGILIGVAGPEDLPEALRPADRPAPPLPPARR